MTDPTAAPFHRLAERFWPGLKVQSRERKLVSTGDILSVLYTLPLALAGVGWLVFVTDLSVIGGRLGFLALHGAMFVLLDRLNYFVIFELRQNRYGTVHGSLDTTLLWSTVLLFGPTALWLILIWRALEFALRREKGHSRAAWWNNWRGFVQDIADSTLPYLTALTFLERLGGQVPLKTFDPRLYLLGLVAIGVAFLVSVLIWSGYIAYGIWTQIQLTASRDARPVVRFLVLALGLPVFGHPFGILAAGLYVIDGVFIYTQLLIALAIVALLTRRLSEMAERNRQQSRLLNKLEQLSRAIINTPPGEDRLIQLLRDHVPSMFPSGRLVVWRIPDEPLVRNPDEAEWIPPLASLSSTLLESGGTRAFLSQDPLPWLAEDEPHYPAILCPIIDLDVGDPIGGIYLELRPLAQPWRAQDMDALISGVQSLAAQVASAIHQVKTYRQTLDYQRVTQELQLAGEIQISFLPFNIPRLEGWQLSLTLDPVEETSGDFFDIIPLGDNRLGIVVADVADKGVGPALYMALSRTLIRTYAIEFDARPDIVFFATNERILKDTGANLFVTAFYGILDLVTGELSYCNAGHNPPFLLRLREPDAVLPLRRTGIPIGIESGVTWTEASVHIQAGDALVLYTDGVPDAQDVAGNFFSERKLVEIARQNLGRTAEEIQTAILDEVYAFVGDAPQFDDITLLILSRDE